MPVPQLPVNQNFKHIVMTKEINGRGNINHARSSEIRWNSVPNFTSSTYLRDGPRCLLLFRRLLLQQLLASVFGHRGDGFDSNYFVAHRHHLLSCFATSGENDADVLYRKYIRYNKKMIVRNIVSFFLSLVSEERG